MIALVSVEKDDPQRSDAAKRINQQETPPLGPFAFRDSLIGSQ